MIAPLATVVITASLLLAAGTALLAVLRRRAERATTIAVAVVEVLVLAQVVASVVLLAGGQRGTGGGEGAAFVAEMLGYHVATLLVLPAALAWTRADHSRWSPLVPTVAALAIAVMVVRLGQLWVGIG